MSLSQLVLTQLEDPFRIALIIGLVVTMVRTRAQTGTVVPLAAGVLFVAGVIPSTPCTQRGEPVWAEVGAGGGSEPRSNLVILGVVLGAWEAFRRLTRR